MQFFNNQNAKSAQKTLEMFQTKFTKVCIACWNTFKNIHSQRSVDTTELLFWISIISTFHYLSISLINILGSFENINKFRSLSKVKIKQICVIL